MPRITPFLEELISISGLSGHEMRVAEAIRRKWETLSDEVSVSRVGSVQAIRRGKAAGTRRSILIATHMDAIGLMVTDISDGLLHVSQVGGIDPRILPGTPVIVHGTQDLPAVVVLPPAYTLLEAEREGAPVLRNLLVDTGLAPSKVAKAVHVGDLVSFATQPVHLAGNTLSGHTLDNRASVAALTACLEVLQTRDLIWDVWAVATSQEEETMAGAYTSSYALQPDLAVAVDVTFAKASGSGTWRTFELGQAPTLGWGANIHGGLYNKFKALANQLDFPSPIDLVPTRSGTDAYGMQIAREGIPTMLLGIPLRYMHTAVEVVSIADVLRTGRLLAEFVCSLDDRFMSTLTMEVPNGD